MARFWAGFDVAKAFHWVCVVDEEGRQVFSRRVEASEEGIEAALEELDGLGDAELAEDAQTAVVTADGKLLRNLEGSRYASLASSLERVENLLR